MDKVQLTIPTKKSFYAGLFIISFCLLAVEILLTRILSVIFWYHFAFFVISVALFGMTVGALIIYLCPQIFSTSLTKRHIAIAAYVSSFAILLSLISLFYLPALFASWRILDALMPLLYLLLSLPFVSIGICLSLTLSRFPHAIDKLYSINLLGSALGCLGIIFILNSFNAPSAILFLAALCAFSALLFAYEGGLNVLFRRSCTLMMLVFIFLAVGNNYTNSITPRWAKGTICSEVPLYSKWNFFSYLSIGRPSRTPFGWGFSPKVSSLNLKTEELMLTIDKGAGTVLTKFNDLSDLKYLKMDLSAIAYYLRDNKDVLVLGSGAGRDLLTAVLFGAKKVVGVEINQDINDLVYNKMRWFSGSIYKYGQIRWVVDEGRSYISRSQEKYNVIQASLVDSFAALANGAFALSENSLYTKEAWVIFLEHLKEEGILTFCRWYQKNNPEEIYRLIALAESALQEVGIKDARKNIVLVRYFWPQSEIGVGTILVSKAPFSDAEMMNLNTLCENLGFEIVLSPKVLKDQNFVSILEYATLKHFSSDISSPTDNRPFFFYFSRFKDLFAKHPSNQGVKVLRMLFSSILIFAVIFIMLPLFFRPKEKRVSKISSSMVIYFVSIGIAFMLLEVSFMQRLGIFLGHPIYGLTVVLFALLLFCGIGSYLTKYLIYKTRIMLVFVMLLAINSILIYLLPFVVKIATPSPMPIKIALSFILLMLIGLFMGMPFPLGMKIAGGEDAPRVFYWGINGFASICGSALAAVILIHFGFQNTVIAGLICYITASLSLVFHLRASA